MKVPLVLLYIMELYNNYNIATCVHTTQPSLVESVHVHTTVPSLDESVSAKQLVGIVDFANYVGKWINISRMMSIDAVFAIFLQDSQLTPNQTNIITILDTFDELHVVVKTQKARDAGRDHFSRWYKGSLFFHMASSPVLSTEQQKELDDVACIYLRELYIRRGYDAIIVTCDQYRSFVDHTANSFSFAITSWERGHAPGSWVDITQKMRLFTFGTASPNLVTFDPEHCTFWKCPSFPNNRTQRDWVQFCKPGKRMLDFIPTTIDEFDNSSQSTLGESQDEPMPFVLGESQDEPMLPDQSDDFALLALFERFRNLSLAT